MQLEELRNESFILPKSVKEILAKTFDTSEIFPNILAEISHVQTVKSFVSAGVGISILPEEIFEQDDNLIGVALEPPIYLQPAVAYKKNRKRSHAAEAFLSAIRKGVEKNA